MGITGDRSSLTANKKTTNARFSIRVVQDDIPHMFAAHPTCQGWPVHLSCKCLGGHLLADGACYLQRRHASPDDAGIRS